MTKRFAQKIRFGSGALDDVPSIVREAGGRRALLVTTEGRLASPDGEAFRVQRDLELYGMSCHPGGFLQRTR